jgi:hypothetical protein
LAVPTLGFRNRGNILNLKSRKNLLSILVGLQKREMPKYFQQFTLASYTVKRGVLAIFLSPAGMSLIKLSLAGNN